MLEEWRCSQCRHVLARMWLAPGSIIEIKCSCNAYNTREVTASSTNGHGYPNTVSMLVVGQPSTGYLTAER